MESADETTATAHRHWDRRWRSADGRRGWEEPEPAVLALADELRRRGRLRVLDLGCGVGRHAVALGEAGLSVAALDASRAGLEVLAAALETASLDVRPVEGQMTALPFADDCFDAVVSWNVIYHGSESVVRMAIAQIRRVLRPRGLYLGTMLSKRNVHFGQGQEVAADTWQKPGEGDKDHPHYYCDALRLVQLFEGFELRSLRDAPQGKPGSYHWHLLAERKPDRAA